MVRRDRPDNIVETLRGRFQIDRSDVGVAYEDVHADPERATTEIVARYRALAERCDAVVIVGTDYTDVGRADGVHLQRGPRRAPAAPVLLVVNGRGRTPAEIGAAVEMARGELRNEHATALATVVTRVDPGRLGPSPGTDRPDPPAFVLPEVPRLSAPTMSDLMAACDGYLLLGEERQLSREVGGLMVGAMSLPNILDRLTDGAAVIIPADRGAELLPGLIAAHGAATFPALAGLILSGGMELPDPVARLFDGHVGPAAGDHHRGRHLRHRDRLSVVEGRFTPEAERQDRGRAAAVRRARGRDGAARPAARDPVRPGDPADVRVRPDRTRPRATAGTSCCPRAPTSGSCGRPRCCCAAASPT